MSSQASVPLLVEYYRQYARDRQQEAFSARVSRRYTAATLQRLAEWPLRETRRAAVAALGLVGGFAANEVLGRALCDVDRAVRHLAEDALRQVWLRQKGEPAHRQLDLIIALNEAGRYKEAVRKATSLIEQAPDLAEAFNQRAIALYCLGRYDESLGDCRRTLELNPYHFGAAAGMGQCHAQQDDMHAALEAFRRALAINPNLEGIRANVNYLERSLKRNT